jgi:hypothetical protein
MQGTNMLPQAVSRNKIWWMKKFIIHTYPILEYLNEKWQ